MSKHSIAMDVDGGQGPEIAVGSGCGGGGGEDTSPMAAGSLSRGASRRSSIAGRRSIHRLSSDISGPCSGSEGGEGGNGSAAFGRVGGGGTSNGGGWVSAVSRSSSQTSLAVCSEGDYLPPIPPPFSLHPPPPHLSLPCAPTAY